MGARLRGSGRCGARASARGGGLFLSVLLLALLGTPVPASASLEEFFSATGKLSLSVDAAGSNGASHVAQVRKPSAAATVRKAFVMAASWCGAGSIPDESVSLNGTPIAWDQSVVNSFFQNVRADVTALLKPGLDAAPAGLIDVTFAEAAANNGCIDGEVLAVVFDDPAQTRDTTVVLLFGGQALAGDTFAITLAEPIDPAAPGAQADMGLGISFGFQPSGQFSIVNVNDQRLTTSAGGQDDGATVNGGLITVGGLDDSNANPANPTATDGTCGPPAAPRCDDELYSLLPFLGATDTSISVFTQNPSNDDNIFFAYFQLSGAAIVGEGIVLGPTSATNPVGTTHTVTAKVADAAGNPVQGVLVSFTVTAGPNAGDNGSDTTDANGEATFTYTGDGGPGTDQIEASFEDSEETTRVSNTVSKEWTAGACQGPDPCIGSPEEVPQEYTSPGVKLVFDWANVTLVQVTKTGQNFPVGPCRDRLAASNKVRRTELIELPNGATLTAQLASQAKKELRRQQKLQRRGLLAAVNGAGVLEVKMFEINPLALEAAAAAGCAGVRLAFTYEVVGMGPLGNSNKVKGDGELVELVDE